MRQAAQHGASLATAPGSTAHSQHGACHHTCFTLPHSAATMHDACTCPHATIPSTGTSLVMNAALSMSSHEPLLVPPSRGLAQLVLDEIACAEMSV